MHESFYLVLYISLSLLGIAGGGGSSGGGGGGSGGSSFSGGGSSGSGGGDGEFSWLAFIIMIVVWGIIIAVMIYGGLVAKKAVRARREKMRAQLEASSLADPIWTEQGLITFASDIFMRHQKDWSGFDIVSLESYMTPEYYKHTELMLAALKLANRQNQVNDITINSAEIISFDDSPDNTQDHFEVLINASVEDIINDTSTDQVLHRQRLNAIQTYKFLRDGNKWKFSGIDQSTASALTYNAALERFASDNGYFYSIDWGWLLLPRRGQVFGTGQFGASDINNHVIGMYHDVLIQMYSYKPIPTGTKNYLITQTSVPKSYGDIVVRRKKSGFNFKIKGLNKLSTEWGEFNKKYDVFASDTEQATSFELLNPTYMEKLEALPFEVSIEVVDNMVYLYADEAAAIAATGSYDTQRYEVMLQILKAAFKEMRM